MFKKSLIWKRRFKCKQGIKKRVNAIIKITNLCLNIFKLFFYFCASFIYYFINHFKCNLFNYAFYRLFHIKSITQESTFFKLRSNYV